MNTTVKSVKLWGELMPIREVAFLVYSENGFYRQLFCDILKRNLIENYMGSVVIVEPDLYMNEILSNLLIFDDDDLLNKLNNSILKNHPEALLYYTVNNILLDQIFPIEFIIVDGWRFLSDIDVFKENFEINNVIKIKLDAPKDYHYLTDLRDYKEFDYEFGRFTLESGLPEDFNEKIFSMLGDIFGGD